MLNKFLVLEKLCEIYISWSLKQIKRQLNFESASRDYKALVYKNNQYDAFTLTG